MKFKIFLFQLKEKSNLPGNETDESENIDSVNADNTVANKPHVEFKEETEEVPVKEVVPIKVFMNSRFFFLPRVIDLYKF